MRRHSSRDLTRLQHATASADRVSDGDRGPWLVALSRDDRPALAKELGFLAHYGEQPRRREQTVTFALDYLFALAGIATHLSRLAEDFVLFASQEFSYLILPDEYSTGSSLMPQKKNPDAWELLRGKTGRIHRGTFQSVHHAERLALQLPARLAGRQRGPFCRARSDARHDLGRQGALIATKFREDRLVRRGLRIPLFLPPMRPITLLIAACRSVRRTILSRQSAAGSRKNSAKPWTQLSLEDVRKISPLFEKDFLQGPSVESAHRHQSCSGWHGGRIGSRYHRATGTKTQTTGEQAMSLTSSIFTLQSVSHRTEDRRSFRERPSRLADPDSMKHALSEAALPQGFRFSGHRLWPEENRGAGPCASFKVTFPPPPPLSSRETWSSRRPWLSPRQI